MDKRKGLQLLDITRTHHTPTKGDGWTVSYNIVFRINGITSTTSTSHHVLRGVEGRQMVNGALRDEIDDILEQIGFLKPTRTRAIRRYCR